MYADYGYYIQSYRGDILNADNADIWLERASTEIDRMTMDRLQKNGMPTADYHQRRIKYAVCAVAEELYQIDALQKASAASIGVDGMYHGPIASISSGKESISYSSGGSVYAKSAASNEVRNASVNSLIKGYLVGVPDGSGINLLYGGMGGNYVR